MDILEFIAHYTEGSAVALAGSIRAGKVKQPAYPVGVAVASTPDPREELVARYAELMIK